MMFCGIMFRCAKTRKALWLVRRHMSAGARARLVYCVLSPFRTRLRIESRSKTIPPHSQVLQFAKGLRQGITSPHRTHAHSLNNLSVYSKADNTERKKRLNYIFTFRLSRKIVLALFANEFNVNVDGNGAVCSHTHTHTNIHFPFESTGVRLLNI